MGNLPALVMKLLVLTATLLLVQLSDQAAVNRAEYNEDEAYYWCPCSFQQYEDLYGYPYKWMDEDSNAWCPCFSYDEYDGYEYAYEVNWDDKPAAEGEERRRKSKKKHH